METYFCKVPKGTDTYQKLVDFVDKRKSVCNDLENWAKYKFGQEAQITLAWSTFHVISGLGYIVLPSTKEVKGLLRVKQEDDLIWYKTDGRTKIGKSLNEAIKVLPSLEKEVLFSFFKRKNENDYTMPGFRLNEDGNYHMHVPCNLIMPEDCIEITRSEYQKEDE